MSIISSKHIAYQPLSTIRLSHSTIELLHSCPRKLQFYKVFRNSQRQSSFSAEIGHTLHKAYQTYLATKDENHAIAELIKAYPIELETQWDKDRDMEACLSTLLALIECQTSYDTLAEIKNKDGQLVPAVEVPFEIVTNQTLTEGGKPISFVGFIDAIMYNKQRNEYYVVDLKTHRLNLNDLTPKYQYDEQCTPYGLVLSAMTQQKITSFNVRYLTAFVDLVKASTKEYTFVKQMTDLVNWGKVVKKAIDDIRYFNDQNWFPRRANTCLAYNRPCQHFDYCGEPDNDHLQKYLLAGMIEQQEKPFEPLFRIEMAI